MQKLRGRRSRGYLNGFLFGIGKESCVNYKSELEAYKANLEGEVEASNESVTLVKEIVEAEITIATNDEKIGLYQEYGKGHKEVIRASGKTGKYQIREKTKEQLKKEKLENDLWNLAEQLSGQIK